MNDVPGIPPAPGGGGAATPGPRSTVQGRRADISTVVPVNAFEQTLFSVAYIVTHDNEHTPMLSWVLTIIEDIQFLSFSWNLHLHTNGMPPVLAAVVEPTRFLTSYFGFSVVNIIALVGVFTAVVLMGIVSVLTHYQRKIGTPALRLLRILCTLLFTALSIPILNMLLIGLHCTGGNVHDYDMPCAGRHMPLLVFDAIGLCVFVPLILVASLIFIESSPKASTPLARAHGRTDFLAVILRIVFVALDIFSADLGSGGKWLLMIAVVLGLAYLGLQLVRSQPYYDERMTYMRFGFTMAAWSSMVATIVVVAVGSPDYGWIAVIPSAALGFGLSVFGARYYSERFLARTIRTWHRNVRAEIKANTASNTSGLDGIPSMLINPVGFGTLSKQAAGMPGGPPIIRVPDVVSTALMPDSPSETREDGGASGLLGHIRLPPPSPRAPHSGLLRGIQSEPQTPPRKLPPTMSTASVMLDPEDTVLNNLLRGTSLEALNAARERPPKRRIRVFDSPLQVECCIRFIRRNPSAKQVSLGLQLLERGLIEFPKDPLLTLLAATYLSAFYGTEGERAASVLMGELRQSRNAPMDVKFLVYVREKSARSRGINLLDKYHLRAMYAVRDLWEGIRTSTSLESLSQIIVRLANEQSGCRSNYLLMLEKNPRDKTTLRSYAQYLSCIEADTLRATQILELADDVEMSETRARTNMDTGVNNNSIPELRGTANLAGHRTPPSGLISPPPVDTVTMRFMPGSPYTIQPSTSQPASSPSSPPPVRSPARPSVTEPTPPLPLSSDSLAVSSLDSSPASDAMPDPAPRRPSKNPPVIFSRRASRVFEENSLARFSISAQGQRAGMTHSPSGQLLPPPTQQPATFEKPPPPAPPAQNRVSDSMGFGPVNPDFEFAMSHNRSHAPSQTSGTSISRAERQRIQGRRILFGRVTQPLRQPWTVLVPSILFMAALICGFILCLAFTDATALVLNKLSTASLGQRHALEVLESLREMVFDNISRDWTDLATHVGHLKGALESGISLLTDLSQWESGASVAAPRLRMHLARFTSNMINLEPLDMTPVQIYRSVLQAGALGISFSAPGNMTAQAFLQAIELRFLTDNLDTMVVGLRSMAELSVNEYLQLINNSITYMVLAAAASVLFLFLVAVSLFYGVFRKYFSNQNHILRMLQGIPKRAAANMLTAIEEEIENFREVTDMQDDDLIGAQPSSVGINGAQNTSTSWTRTSKYMICLLYMILVVGSMTAGMFLTALASTEMTNDVHRVIQSNSRALKVQAMRVYSTEFFAADATVDDWTCIRQSRSLLYDLQQTHRELELDSQGLAEMLPGETITPRNCSAISPCEGVQPDVRVGFTYELASLPLNDEINRIIDTQRRLIDFMGTVGANRSDSNSDMYRTWQLALSLADDILARLVRVNAGLREHMDEQLSTTITFVGIMFGLTMVASVASLAIYYAFGVLRLRREARVIVMILFMLPPQVTKDVGEIGKFIETNGLALEAMSEGRIGSVAAD
ncbi:hypothetical protein H9P43_002134 [Blastocladiella emersonii ATCC 22665]|nr:hypothetical protein H9P43_002134 [Blastocladiella emersonii ATCC 22665]